MKVCMLAYTFYENDNRVRRYAETLARRGDRVDVVSLNSGSLSDYELIKGVHVYRIQGRVKDEQGKLTYLRKLLRFLVKSARFVSSQHSSGRYDLIHVHSVPDFEVFAAFYPKLCGSKIILDIHDIVPEFYASKFKTTDRSLFFRLLLLLERLSASFADHVIISNHIWWETLVSRSVSRNKCTPILNYPDPDIFFPRPRTRNDDRFVILYPGTVNWHQGLDIAVRAFAMVKDEIPKAEFHIYGGTIKNNPLTDLIARLGLEDRVFFKGFLPIDQIADVMANADLGVVPKRNDPFGGEAFSTKILEFMSLGVPVVVSRTKVDDYYFNDNVVRFFQPEDEADLANSILVMARDQGLRSRYAANASGFVANYSWERNKEHYLDMVDGLLGQESQEGRV